MLFRWIWNCVWCVEWKAWTDVKCTNPGINRRQGTCGKHSVLSLLKQIKTLQKARYADKSVLGSINVVASIGPLLVYTWLVQRLVTTVIGESELGYRITYVVSSSCIGLLAYYQVLSSRYNITINPLVLSTVHLQGVVPTRLYHCPLASNTNFARVGREGIIIVIANSSIYNRMTVIN